MPTPEITVRIQDFRAIKDAALKLNGLTVLSGLNGSGKSTIAKTLYYAIKTALNYETILDKLLFDEIEAVMERYCFFLRNLMTSMIRGGALDHAEKIDPTYLLKENNSVELFAAVDRIFAVAAFLENKINKVADEKKRRFFFSLLSRADSLLVFSGSKNPPLNSAHSEITESFSRDLSEATDQNEKQKEKRTLHSFIKLCATVARIEIPSSFSYTENGIEIFDKQEKTVRPIQEIEAAYYIDTPWIVDFLGTPTPGIHTHWRETLMTIYEPDDFTVHSPFAEHIAKTIRGYALRKKEDPRLFFEREDKQSFLLRDVATGIKGLSIIQRLAEKHAFDEKTLLILDEPESHLHPQWIVEYARILVLMQKKLGVKMLIASHSPDMIEAIQEFAKREGISDRTNFYLAEKFEANEFSYEYKPLGISIAKIFKVFNIATKRILDYSQE